VLRVESIEAALSPLRMHRFVQHCGGSRTRALRLYRWNAQVASAYWTPLHFLEVAVRNAVHDAMHTATADEWWFADPAHTEGAAWLHDREHDAICKAIDKVQTLPVTAGKVVAELSFGFWAGLLSGHWDKDKTHADYHAYVWVQGGVAKRFPQTKRGVLWKRLDRLRRFRNRIAHHEHLLDANFELMSQDIDSTLKLLDPALATWVRAMSDVPRLIRERPLP
jgi:Abi-like protein